MVSLFYLRCSPSRDSRVCHSGRSERCFATAILCKMGYGADLVMKAGLEHVSRLFWIRHGVLGQYTASGSSVTKCASCRWEQTLEQPFADALITARLASVDSSDSSNAKVQSRLESCVLCMMHDDSNDQFGTCERVHSCTVLMKVER